jgi:hypothetical protein
MKKESLEKRLFDILSDLKWHDSYTLTHMLNGHNRPLFRLSGRTSDLKRRGCSIETKTEKQLLMYPINNKRVWYRLNYLPENIFDTPLPKYRRDKQSDQNVEEICCTLSDGSRLCII